MIRALIPFIIGLTTCLAPAAVAAAPCWEELGIQPLHILRWSEQEQLCGYRNMEHLWTSHTVRAGNNPLPLPNMPMAVSDVAGFMRSNHVYGMIVVVGGKVVLEKYRDGFGPDQRWTSFSMAKSLTSLLAGFAFRDGKLRSLDDRVARYIPELAKGAYADVTIRQVLTMTSGVAWNENYRDPRSDVAALADIAASSDQAFLTYMASRPRQAEPGEVFNYSTGEAGIVGRLVARATGRSLSAYMAEKLWSGMERDAVWITDRSGVEVSGCCFSATMRDYARIGLFLLDAAKAGDHGPFPGWWLREAVTASPQSMAAGRPYGFQVWIRDNGSFQASGIFGQLIHVDPRRDLVIVMMSAWPLPTGTRAIHAERTAFVTRVKQEVDAARAGGSL